MRAPHPIKTTIVIFLSLFVFPVQGQKLLKKVKNKMEDKVVEVVDEELNGENDTKRSDEMAEAKRKGYEIDRSFISRSDVIFHDDFDNERQGEFPKNWTQISGTVENGMFEYGGRMDGVVQMVSTKSVIKPTFDTDEYLGDSFKIELQHYFWQRGNEAYIIQLHGERSSRPAYQIYLRSTNVAPGSDEVVYMAGKQNPGWYTSQISFNRGNLKVIVNGQQLVNNPDINIRELTHLSLYTLSPSSNSGDGYMKARVNYFTIAKEGLPLYDRLVTKGRIIVQDIYFDNNKYTLKPQSYPALDKILKLLKEHPDTEVTIEGHTDSNGSEESNQTLSEHRANAVKKYLVSNGIKSSRMSTVGYGEERPIDPSDNEKAWTTNRRVEFVLR